MFVFKLIQKEVIGESEAKLKESQDELIVMAEKLQVYEGGRKAGK
jgi:hypothetical protein